MGTSGRVELPARLLDDWLTVIRVYSERDDAPTAIECREAVNHRPIVVLRHSRYRWQTAARKPAAYDCSSSRQGACRIIRVASARQGR